MRDARFCNASCPLARTLGQIGNKWKPLILNQLQTRTLRFGQLHAVVPHITRKVLTEQLKELVEDGLLHRQAYTELPPRVEYTLTEKGLGLLPIFRTMMDWNLAYDGKFTVFEK